jgi:ADP-ribosylation factor GTPase-activating protein 1
MHQASPKLGIFMCLSCSGVHRGLGVHISFIRSITMDAFKGAELARMAAGGNKPFQEFFNSHASNTKDSRTFEASSIQERYDCEAGDEWKERLSCKVEGREFDKSNLPKRLPKKENVGGMGSGAPLSGRASAAGSRSQTPLGKTRSNDVRSSSPSLGTNAMSSQKQKNETYFAKMGAANADRPDGVAPNQGGKYGGFGSEPDHWKKEEEPGAPPALDDFQKDPVAALTKGFGWLGASVSKVGKTGYEGWVKPGMQKVRSLLNFTSNKPTSPNILKASRSRPSNPSPTHRWHTRSNPLLWCRQRRHNIQPLCRRRVIILLLLHTRTREERLLGLFWRRAKGAGERQTGLLG